MISSSHPYRILCYSDDLLSFRSSSLPFGRSSVILRSDSDVRIYKGGLYIDSHASLRMTVKYSLRMTIKIHSE